MGGLVFYFLREYNCRINSEASEGGGCERPGNRISGFSMGLSSSLRPLEMGWGIQTGFAL